MDIETLNKTPHNQICDLAKGKFIEIYNQKFGEGGEAFFEEQKALFNNELENGSYKGYLEKAPSLNIHDAFMNLAINGLSLEKGSSTLCYLMGYSNYDKNTKTYSYSAKITYTGYGEILLRQRAGQIVRCDNPVIVYNCDDFRFGEKDGKKFVDYVKTYPRPRNSYIIACYVKIILPSGGYDYSVLDREGIDRLREYSMKFGGGKANALYGGTFTNQDGSQTFKDIDTGFLISKTCKHAFRTYSKLAIGLGGQLQANVDTQQATQEQKPQEVFGGSQQAKNGVKVETEDSDPF